MVHAADGVREGDAPARDARGHLVDRAGRDEHGHGRGARDDQPPAGAAAARRHVRDAAPGPGAAAARAPAAGDVSVNDCFRPVARFFDRIARPEQLLTALPEAMRVLTSPVETGAVVLALPQDVQAARVRLPRALLRAARVADRAAAARRARGSPRRVELLRAARAAAARSPAAASATPRPRPRSPTFAGAAGIPVVETFAGKGSVVEDAWFRLGGLGLEGNPGANEIARDADVVVAVGTRLTDFATGSHSLFQNPDVRFVAINVDGRDAHKVGRAADRGRRARGARGAGRPRSGARASRAELPRRGRGGARRRGSSSATALAEPRRGRAHEPGRS